MSRKEIIIGQCFYNGRVIAAEKFAQLTKAAVESDRHDGIFETLKLSKGKLPPYLSEHQLRLLRNIETLYAEAGSLLSAELRQTLLSNFQRQIIVLSKCLNTEHAVLRYQLIIERGSLQVDNLLQLRQYQAAPTPVRIQLSNLQLRFKPCVDGRKSIDRRVYTDALTQVPEVDVYDVLLKDCAGNIIEGTKTNIFLLNDNTLVTADLVNGGVAGVMRAHVIKQALQQGLNVTIASVTESQIIAADAVFLTNAVIGIKAVDEVLNAEGERTKYARKSNVLANKNLVELMANI